MLSILAPADDQRLIAFTQTQSKHCNDASSARGAVAAKNSNLGSYRSQQHRNPRSGPSVQPMGSVDRNGPLVASPRTLGAILYVLAAHRSDGLADEDESCKHLKYQRIPITREH